MCHDIMLQQLYCSWWKSLDINIPSIKTVSAFWTLLNYGNSSARIIPISGFYK